MTMLFQRFILQIGHIANLRKVSFLNGGSEKNWLSRTIQQEAKQVSPTASIIYRCTMQLILLTRDETWGNQ